ncbi:hypothetical protein PUN28_005782 [Cardiocondyla obscurior]|uniref:Uncharacterized protein n=1 Tax=Cardiocondyla obscurior TaxID=286306 RepID=A0AAW2G5F9_9HYME
MIRRLSGSDVVSEIILRLTRHPLCNNDNGRYRNNSYAGSRRHANSLVHFCIIPARPPSPNFPINRQTQRQETCLYKNKRAINKKKKKRDRLLAKCPVKWTSNVENRSSLRNKT